MKCQYLFKPNFHKNADESNKFFQLSVANSRNTDKNKFLVTFFDVLKKLRDVHIDSNLISIKLRLGTPNLELLLTVLSTEKTRKTILFEMICTDFLKQNSD